MCRDTPKPKDDDYLASRQKKNTLFKCIFIWSTQVSLFKFLHSFIFLFFTCDLLTCPICQHSSLLTLSCLCFYLFFYHPSLQLSFISLFLFFHSSTPSLFPRAHIFIEPSRPWTSAHCNNAIRQGDCVAFKVCVCVWESVKHCVHKTDSLAHCHTPPMP